MKTYFGNYLGLVVGDNDPDQRGRVQIFIPHIMPALYEGWNEEGKNISFNVTGNNIPEGLSKELIDKLQTMLPWAECAAPIFGAGPAGKYNPATGELDSAVHNAGAVQDLPPMPSPDGVSLISGGAKYLDDASSNELSSKLSRFVSRSPGKSWCGRDTTDALRSVGLLPGAPGMSAGANARELGGVFRKAGWTEVKINKPDDAPVNSVVIATNINQGGSSKSFGHANIKVQGGFLRTGQGPGKSGISKNFGPIESNEDLYAYIPPEAAVKRVLPNASYNLGSAVAVSTEKGTGVGPSADKPIAADINTHADPKQEGTEVQNQDTVTYQESDFSKNEILFAMRIAATESGAGVGGSLENLNDIEQRVGYAYGFGQGLSVTELKAKGRELIDSGSVDWKKVDIGYVQSNGYNNAQNYGSYKDQVLSTAKYVRELAGKSGRLGSEVLKSINSGNFNEADRVLGSKNNDLTIGTKYYGLGDSQAAADQLVSKVNSQYNGDVAAALNGINSELPPTPNIDNLVAGVGIVSTVQHPSQSFSDNRDVNNMPTGMFGSARIGQLVWVFFQEGNPLFPVYFAASYGQTEWANAQMHSSPDKIKESGGAQSAIHLDGGYISSSQIVGGNEAGFKNDAFSMSVGGKNGSNLNFTEHTTHLFSKYDFRGHTQCDHHSIVGGNREVRTVGDHNIVVEQDFILTVGNWGKEALDAAAEIQSVIDEAMNAAKGAIES